MGAKTNVDQATTLTPQQKALLDMQMRGVTNSMQGFNLGTGWGGPSFESYNPNVGYGGMKFDTSRGALPTSPLPGASLPGRAVQQSGLTPTNPMMAALQSVAVPSAPGMPGGAGRMVNPTSPTAYSNRENLVSPLVNPFRRNLG